jgi:DNA-binding response OmpR family regulator
MTVTRGSILIVEDHESLRHILAYRLRAAGLDVIEAASAEEAAQAFEGGLRPGVVLLDLNLPGSTGWDLLRGDAIRAAGDPPVLISSATAVSPRLLAEFNVAGFLPKPCPIDTILDAVGRVLDREETPSQP